MTTQLLYSCPHCKRSFNSKRVLQQHFRRFSSCQVGGQCTICGVFTGKDVHTLWEHMRWCTDITCCIDCCEAQDDDAASTSGGGIASSTIAPGVGNMFELVDDDDNDNALSNLEEQYSNGKREAYCSPVFARKCGKSDDECSSGDYSGDEGLGDDVQGVDGRGEGGQGDEVMFEEEPSNAVFGDERDKKRYDFVHLLTDDQIHFDTDAPSE
ncbi:MAG: hypothetical protein ACREOZ_03590, partial [Gloeomargaritales cyanobacterium]